MLYCSFLRVSSPWAEVSPACCCRAATPAARSQQERAPPPLAPGQAGSKASFGFQVGEKEVGKLVPSPNNNISVVWDFSSLAWPVAVTLSVCKLLPAQLRVGNEEKPAVVPGTELGRGNAGI